MPLDPRLLEILACPQDHGPLLYFAGEGYLYNPRLRRRYAVVDDIPNMMIDEAETVADDEHERLLRLAADQGVRPTFEASETPEEPDTAPASSPASARPAPD